MFILVKDKLPLKDVEESELILQLNEDGKTFRILRKDGIQLKNVVHHNSMLKHFILYCSPYSKEVEKDEETDRVSGRQT